MPQANERKGREETADCDGKRKTKEGQGNEEEKEEEQKRKAAKRARKAAEREAEKDSKERERAERARRLKRYSKTLLTLERKEAHLAVVKKTYVLNKNDEVMTWTPASTLMNAAYVWVCILKI